jgi:uncharacterized protein (DUF2336 family)
MPQTVPENAERLAAVPPSQRHSVLIRSLANLFSVVPEHLPEDLERFEALFRPLYREADAADRRSVVAVLARRRDLPPTVAEDFMRDDPAIAALYLETAPEPDETVLLRAVARGSAEVRHLIADRPHLSEPVVLALLVAGDEIVVDRLAANPTAAIPENLIEDLEAEAADVVAAPADGPATGATDAATAGAVDRFAEFLALGDAERLDDLHGRIAASAFGIPETAGHASRRAPPADLFAKACIGDRAGLARSLAAALDLSDEMATTILDDTGGEPLAVALAALGVDETLATSLLLLCLPEEARSYWRLGLLRDLHERLGWRAAGEILDRWRPERPAPAVRRQMDDSVRPAQPVARRRRVLRPADLARRV